MWTGQVGREARHAPHPPGMQGRAPGPQLTVSDEDGHCGLHLGQLQSGSGATAHAPLEKTCRVANGVTHSLRPARAGCGEAGRCGEC